MSPSQGFSLVSVEDLDSNFLADSQNYGCGQLVLPFGIRLDNRAASKWVFLEKRERKKMRKERRANGGIVIVRALRSGYRSSCSKNSGSLHRDRLLMSLIALHMYFLSLGKQLPWWIIRHYSANADQCCRQTSTVRALQRAPYV